MQWWCSAQGVAWSWEWQAYPGVWLFILAVALLYTRLRRVAEGSGGAAAARGRPVVYGLGVLALWLALDWPIGALGGGYLASAHMVQFLLIAYVAAPLLLLGVPRGVFHALDRSAVGPAVRTLTHPMIALLGFNLIVAVTHLPAPTDALMVSQLGSFLIDAVWIAAGLLFWWPVCAPAPSRPWLQAPVRVGYLALQAILGTPVFAYLAFAEFPLYAVYELAPRVHGISARADQQAAGMIMKVIGMPILMIATAILFLRWASGEERAEASARRELASRPDSARSTP